MHATLMDSTGMVIEGEIDDIPPATQTINAAQPSGHVCVYEFVSIVKDPMAGGGTRGAFAVFHRKLF